MVLGLSDFEEIEEPKKERSLGRKLTYTTAALAVAGGIAYFILGQPGCNVPNDSSKRFLYPTQIGERL